MDERELGAVSALLTEFSTRVNDLEERSRLIRERLLTLSQTVLKQNERLNKEIGVLKEDMREIRNESDRLKEAVEHIIRESSELARKEELRVVERYMKLFEPLKFATIEDVKRIVKKELKKKKDGIIEIEE
ncbi:MAG: hypothetical protein IB618_03405 [Candidatus Pacearchaeota archaeon]|nr:MAG: hypothetical protein IB618_03405 [Candidatus Pacearchaeota archaeon]